MADALPNSSTIAFFHNANGGNPEFLNLSQDRSLPDLDLSFIPRPFTVISACGGMILIRVGPAGSYYVFNPLYPSNVGLKCIPDPQISQPEETPTVIFVKPQAYEIVSAVYIDEEFLEGYYFYKYSSYLEYWAPDGCIDLYGRKILANTGVCWKSQAFWLTEAPHEIVCHNLDTTYTKLIRPPGTEPITPGTRLQLGVAREQLSLLIVEYAVVRLYHYGVLAREDYWTPAYSVNVYRGGAEVESMNGHPCDQIVCRNVPQPLRFDSRALEVLFLVDQRRFVLWKNVNEVTNETRVVTLIQAVQPENNLASSVAKAVPFVFSNTPPPAGAWPSSQPVGFTLRWN